MTVLPTTLGQYGRRAQTILEVLRFLCMVYFAMASQYFVFVPPASAADVAPSLVAPAPTFVTDDLWTRSYLFGDWAGSRPALHNLGIDVTLTGVDEAGINLSGGLRQTAQQAGQLTLQADFDLQKSLGLEGGSFLMTLVGRWGRNLAADAGIPALQLIDEVYGRGNIVRLEEFAYKQKLFGGLIEIKLGRLAVSDDFFFSSCDFLNLTFCGGQPGNIAGNYIYNWPLSQWAAVGKLNFGSQGYVQSAVYDSNPAYLATTPNIALLPSFPAGSQGVLLPFELGWTPKLGSLAGVYKLGGWYNSDAAPNVATSLNGEPILVSGLPALPGRGRSGVYLSLEQQLTYDSSSGDARNGLSTFFNTAFADRRTSTQDYQIAWGLKQHGLWASRSQDEIGLALGTTQVNPAIANAQALANSLGVGPGYTQRNEYEMEVWYGWQATGWLNLKFDAQYIICPGGYSSNTNRNALVLGGRTSVFF